MIIQYQCHIVTITIMYNINNRVKINIFIWVFSLYFIAIFYWWYCNRYLNNNITATLSLCVLSPGFPWRQPVWATLCIIMFFLASTLMSDHFCLISHSLHLSERWTHYLWKKKLPHLSVFCVLLIQRINNQITFFCLPPLWSALGSHTSCGIIHLLLLDNVWQYGPVVVLYIAILVWVCALNIPFIGISKNA